MLIYSILLEYVTLVMSISLNVTLPLRRDFYISSSISSICMEIFHFYPNGPRHLYGKFNYSRYSELNSQNKKIYGEYFFNRVDRPCETSVIFTTFGDDFDNIHIEMTLSLTSNAIEISQFIYTFKKGFVFGSYALQDKKNIFGMQIKVFQEAENYIGVSNNSEIMHKLDKKFIKQKNNAICIITDNNLAAVIKTKDKNINSSDFIVGLYVRKSGSSGSELYSIYNAYACYKDDAYPDIPVTFIAEETKLRIKFELISAYYSSKKRLYRGYVPKREMMIEVPDILFDHIHNLKNIPPKYTKIFLKCTNIEFELCPDLSKVKSYYSNDKTLCYTITEVRTKINHYVEGYTRVYRPPYDPCGKYIK